MPNRCRCFLYFLCVLFVLVSLLKADAVITTAPGTPGDWALVMSPPALDIDPLFTRPPRGSEESVPAKEEEEPDTPEPSYVGDKRAKQLASVERALLMSIPPYDGDESWMMDLQEEFPWIDPNVNHDNLYVPLTRAYSFQIRSYFLRYFCALPQIPTTEMDGYLLFTGQPAWIEAKYMSEEVAQRKSLSILFPEQLLNSCEYIMKAILPSQQDWEVLEGNDWYENAMLKLLMMELSQRYAYDMDRDFAHHTKMLGREITPFLVRIVKESQHRLIRRNAFALLTTLHSESIYTFFREMLNDEDLVIRNRSIMALTRARDKESIPKLLELAKGDGTAKAFPIYALGILGVEKAIPFLVEDVKKKILHLNTSENFSSTVDWYRYRTSLWTSVFALLRISIATGNEISVLTKLPLQPPADISPPAMQWAEREWRSDRTMESVAAIYCFLHGVPVPEAPEDKKDSISDFVAAMKTPDALFSSSIQYLMVNDSFSSRCHYILFEFINRHPEKFSKDCISKIIEKGGCYSGLRYWMLRHHAFDNTKETMELLKKIITSKRYNSLERAAALFALFRANETEGISFSSKMFPGFLKAYNKQKSPSDGYEIITAIAILRETRRLRPLEDLLEEFCWLKDVVFPGFDFQNAHQSRFLPAPLARVAVRELGRLGNRDRVETFKKILLDTVEYVKYRKPKEKGHAKLIGTGYLKMKILTAKSEALQALGVCGGEEASKLCLRFLDSKDLWYRLLAARSLEKMYDHEIECDWLYGSKADRRSATRAWEAYAKDHKDDWE